MKTSIIRPLLLALAIASVCSGAIAQTTPPPTDTPTDSPTSSQPSPTTNPSDPTDATNPAIPPTPSDPTTDGMAPPVTDSSTDPTIPGRASDPAVAPASDASMPLVDESADYAHDERRGGFQWGLLGLLGLLGLVPRKAKVVETYSARDTTPRTGPGYDQPRSP